jgi:hypothetical protein
LVCAPYSDRLVDHNVSTLELTGAIKQALPVHAKAAGRVSGIAARSCGPRFSSPDGKSGFPRPIKHTFSRLGMDGVP